MTKYFIFKINIKKSKIPRYLKLPKFVYPPYSIDKKPSPFYVNEIDLKKSEFIFEIGKGVDLYGFKRVDPYPQIWSYSNGFNLFQNKDNLNLFEEQFNDSFFISHMSFNKSRIIFDKSKKTLTNLTQHFAGKKKESIKLYDETYIHYDLKIEKDAKDLMEVLPEYVKNKLTKNNAMKALDVIEKKPKPLKEFFSTRQFSYQAIFNSYDKYNILLIAKKLQELKYYVLPENQSYSDKKAFYGFFNQLIELIFKLHEKPDYKKIFQLVIVGLSHDKDPKVAKKYLEIYFNVINEFLKK